MNEQSNHSPDSISSFDPVRGRQILTAAIEQEKNELLAGIKIYLWQLGAVSNRALAEANAEDIFQEMSLTAHIKADRFDPERPPRPWLLTIAINHIRHLSRSHIVERRRLVQLEAVPPPRQQKNNWSVVRSEANQSDEGELEELSGNSSLTHPMTEDKEGFDDLISGVSESHQRILRLRFIVGLQGKDLAAALKISEGAANTRVSRALSELRRIHIV